MLVDLVRRRDSATRACGSLATGMTDVGRPDAHDEEADLEVKWFPLDEAVRWC